MNSYGVNDIYKCVRVFEIVVPELADLVLASHVPDVQLYIVEFHSFHVELSNHAKVTVA